MTEKEWLEGKKVWPTWQLLRAKRGSWLERKWRLFEVACCRQIWHIMTDSRCRRAVEVAERFADDVATAEELAAARDAVRVRDRRHYVINTGSSCTTGDLARTVARESAGPFASGQAISIALRHAGQETNEVAEAELEARQMELLRDIFGNPFRPPPPIDPAWREWHDAIIGRLAAIIYAERTFDRLPILADALEEAGCGDADLLGHLRGPGPHVRGCWALDLVIGME